MADERALAVYRRGPSRRCAAILKAGKALAAISSPTTSPPAPARAPSSAISTSRIATSRRRQRPRPLRWELKHGAAAGRAPEHETIRGPADQRTGVVLRPGVLRSPPSRITRHRGGLCVGRPGKGQRLYMGTGTEGQSRCWWGYAIQGPHSDGLTLSTRFGSLSGFRLGVIRAFCFRGLGGADRPRLAHYQGSGPAWGPREGRQGRCSWRPGRDTIRGLRSDHSAPWLTPGAQRRRPALL